VIDPGAVFRISLFPIFPVLFLARSFDGVSIGWILPDSWTGSADG
jgi:hypothetical protein